MNEPEPGTGKSFFRETRRQSLGFPAFLLGVAAFSILAANLPVNCVGVACRQDVFVPGLILAGIVEIAIASYMLLRLLVRKAGLALDDEGIEEWTTEGSHHRIRWHDIVAIRRELFHGTHVLAIDTISNGRRTRVIIRTSRLQQPADTVEAEVLRRYGAARGSTAPAGSGATTEHL